MTIIQFFVLLFNYIQPTYWFKRLDDKVIDSTSNVSGKVKVRLSRLFLAFYLSITFLAIWLTYTELHSVVKTISNVTYQSCIKGMGDCFDNNLVIYVKQNTFNIEAFIEVFYLMIGVIVGNVGWDLAARIKENGFDVIPKALTTLTIILLCSFAVTAVATDFLPNNTVLKNSYTYRVGGWAFMTAVFLAIHVIYSCKKSKALNILGKSSES